MIGNFNVGATFSIIFKAAWSDVFGYYILKCCPYNSIILKGCGILPFFLNEILT